MCDKPAKMYSAMRKIHKDKNADPTEFEESVAQVKFLIFPWNLLQAFC